MGATGYTPVFTVPAGAYALGVDDADEDEDVVSTLAGDALVRVATFDDADAFPPVARTPRRIVALVAFARVVGVIIVIVGVIITPPLGRVVVVVVVIVIVVGVVAPDARATRRATSHHRRPPIVPDAPLDGRARRGVSSSPVVRHRVVVVVVVVVVVRRRPPTEGRAFASPRVRESASPRPGSGRSPTHRARLDDVIRTSSRGGGYTQRTPPDERGTRRVTTGGDVDRSVGKTVGRSDARASSSIDRSRVTFPRRGQPDAMLASASSVSTTAFAGVKVVSKTTARAAKRAVAARAGQYDDELLETAVRFFCVCVCSSSSVSVSSRRDGWTRRWMDGCPRARSIEWMMTMRGCVRRRRR